MLELENLTLKQAPLQNSSYSTLLLLYYSTLLLILLLQLQSVGRRITVTVGAAVCSC